MRLIVNGDDFGYSPGQNYGIIDAYKNGILRSASLMVQGEYADDALDLARANPGLGVGVHLILDYGRPLSPSGQVPSLVDEKGSFLRPVFEGPIDLSPIEVQREWEAQIRWVQARGIKPTHLDSHHHFHLHPQLLAVTCALAQMFSLPFRTVPLGWPEDGAYHRLAPLKRPDVSLVGFYSEGVGPQFFTELLVNNPRLRDKSVEVMCHPAYLDDFLLVASRYNLPRVRELQILKSPEVARWVQDNGVKLISYRDL